MFARFGNLVDQMPLRLMMFVLSHHRRSSKMYFRGTHTLCHARFCYHLVLRLGRSGYDLTVCAIYLQVPLKYVASSCWVLPLSILEITDSRLVSSACLILVEVYVRATVWCSLLSFSWQIWEYCSTVFGTGEPCLRPTWFCFLVSIYYTRPCCSHWYWTTVSHKLW